VALTIPTFRDRLARHGLTVRSFARLTGMHETTVSGWGTARGPVPRWALRLLDAWDAAPGVLVAARGETEAAE
jgi:hypothetical protein